MGGRRFDLLHRTALQRSGCTSSNSFTLSKHPFKPICDRYYRPSGKPRRSRQAQHDAQREQDLCDRVGCCELDQQSHPGFSLSPRPLCLAMFGLLGMILRYDIGFLLFVLAQPSFSPGVAAPLLHAIGDDLRLDEGSWQPVCVVEQRGEAEKWNNGCQLMEQEEGRDVRDRRRSEGVRVAMEKFWESGVQPEDSPPNRFFIDPTCWIGLSSWCLGSLWLW